MSWNYEATRKGYAKMWDSILIKGGKDATNANYFAKLIIKGEKQYKEVEAATGWPWYFIGALHMRESGCSFDGVLHNGEKIIGKGRKTRLVPKGRGPFKTWAAAAIDAIGLKAHLVAAPWCPALMGFVSECFNGLGYVGHKTNSPYCWAGSNHEQTGKYVADHVWDKNFDDPQIGTLTVLKKLCELRPDVAAAMAEKHVSPITTGKVIKSATELVVNNKKTAGTIAGGVVATGGAAATDTSNTLDQFQPIIDVFQNHGGTIALIFTAVIIIGAVGWHYYEKSQAQDVAA